MKQHRLTCRVAFINETTGGNPKFWTSDGVVSGKSICMDPQGVTGQDRSAA
jgi:hypothetical protein